MTKRLYVQEAVSLAPKRADGSYPVILITEGEGSTGRYSRELLENSEGVFSGVASFLNHPIDPEHPEQRDVNTIAGRFGAVRAEEREGAMALSTDFTPRSEYAAFLEEFADILGLSVYCGAKGTVLEDGRLDVESFDAKDPYRSVDIVVAAGRGGRFERATESLRAIESSLGTPPAAKPGVTSASAEKETHMDEKAVKALIESALAEALKPIVDFVNESKATKATEAQAQVDAEAVESAVTEALSTYDEKVKAIEAADLLEPQVEDLRERARKGEDITKGIESAKKIVEAAEKRLTESKYVIEGSGADDDFRVGGL